MQNMSKDNALQSLPQAIKQNLSNMPPTLPTYHPSKHRCPLSAPSRYGGNLQKMTAMQDKFDPERVFEPELWRRVVTGESYSYKPQCVLDRSCYCDQDIHCGEGFVCVPSLAFPEFKQCRPRVMN